MRLAEHYRPEECVSKGPYQDDRIAAPFVDATAKMVIATDGHGMVALPAGLDDGEASRYVGREELRRARGEVPPPPPPPDVPDKGTVFPAGCLSIFPSFKRGDPGTASIALSAEVLGRVARAIGAERGEVVLTFKVRDTGRAELTAVRVDDLRRDHGALACLMPCRMREDDA